MNAGETIARLQPHACSLSPRVDGWSIPEILPEDIAAALGTIKGDSGPSLLAHSKYGHEPRAARKLLARLKGAILTKWAPMETGRLHLFGLMVLDGALMPSLCMVCHGRRELIVDSLRIVCEPCAGTGIGQRSDKSLAIALGVSRGEWLGVWDARYAAMMDLVGAWDTEAKRAMVENLG